MEWPKGEDEPTKYWLSTLPKNITFRDLVDAALQHVQRLLEERHRHGERWQEAEDVPVRSCREGHDPVGMAVPVEGGSQVGIGVHRAKRCHQTCRNILAWCTNHDF